MSDRIRTFGAFAKVADGPEPDTLTVEGICSSEAEDVDGEVILASAMRAAIPAFLAAYPAVREQHDPRRAAGTALAMEVDAQGRTWIQALVTDRETCKKVRTRTLRGFSVGGSVPPGGRDPERPNVIRSLTLSEVSLVDSPAQKEARVTLWKRDDGPPPGWLDASASRAIDARTLASLAHWDEEGAEAAQPAAAKVATPSRDTIEKLAAVARERDGAIAKLAKAEQGRAEVIAKLAQVERAAGARIAKAEGYARRALAQRDDLARRLAAAEGERDAAIFKASAKGAVRGIPEGAVYVVEKCHDGGSVAPAPEADATPRDLIRQLHSGRR